MKFKTSIFAVLVILLFLFTLSAIAVHAADTTDTAASTSTVTSGAFDATLHTTSQAFMSTLDWSAGVYRSLSNPDDQGGILFASRQVYSVDIGNKKIRT